MLELNKLIERTPCLGDLISYLKDKCEVGQTLPGERLLADILGHPRVSLRESLKVAHCLGHVEIQHGKPTKYIKAF